MTRHRVALPMALGLPVVIAIIALAAVLAWTPELPDQVATHWGSGDGPDGFTAVGSLPWMVGGLTAGLSVPFAGLFLALGLPSRTTVAFGTGLAAFMAAVLLTSIAAQRGLADAADVDIDGWWIAAGIVVALVVAAVAALLTPKDRFDGSEPAHPEPAAAVPTRWTGTIRSDTMLGITGLVLLVGLVLFITPLGIAGYIIVPTALALAATAWWRVTIDENGVVVRSALPWPRLRLLPGQITGAEVEHVDALGDFGGWGIRTRSRGTGIVLSTGDAVVIHRRDARPLIVVIEDAHGAAAAINSQLSDS